MNRNTDNGCDYFISNACGKDEPLVASLHANLTARGFDVWWDRLPMPVIENDLRRAFPNGIFCMPLGTKPNLVELQRNVAPVFADPGFFEYAAPDGADTLALGEHAFTSPAGLPSGWL